MSVPVSVRVAKDLGSCVKMKAEWPWLVGKLIFWTMHGNSEKYQTGTSIFLVTGRQEHEVLLVFMAYQCLLLTTGGVHVTVST